MYGDIRRRFYIVDRVGARLELVDHVLDTDTNRPTGERGALLWFRTGSKVVVPQALRVLKVVTAA